MIQPDLFSMPLKFPRARRSDPLSSQVAADELERSGRGKAQAEALLVALHRWPGTTGHELSRVAGLDYHMVMRRGSELVKAGLVYEVRPHAQTVPCQVTGKRLLRRWPTWALVQK